MKFYDVDSEFTFGKYEGKTIKEVFDKDPKYIDFCFNNIDEFYVSPAVLKELKAGQSTIALPKDEEEDDILDSFFEDAEEVEDFDPDISEEDFNWDDEDLNFADDDFDSFDDFDEDDDY